MDHEQQEAEDHLVVTTGNKMSASIDIICTSSQKECNGELLTEDHVHYFKDDTTIIHNETFEDYFNSDGVAYVKSLDPGEMDNRIVGISKTDAMLIKEKIQIIPNDRDIPKFLQYDMEDAVGIARLDIRAASTLHSKGVQTHISGVRTIPDFASYDLDNPGRIMKNTVRPCSSIDPPSSCISYRSELSLTRSQLYNVHSNYQKLKLRFHKLHEDYYRLIRVSGELTNALENSARGNPVDLPTTLKSCIDLHPDLFNQNVRDDSTKREQVHLIKSEMELKDENLTESKLPILGIVPISSRLFDYKKIKFHLISGNVRTKLLLLQALRWKITLSQSAERDEAVNEYTSSDLLGLHGDIASDSGKSILPHLLIPLNVALPHPVQQSAARLLNTLASLRCGRDYLSVSPTVLNVVVQCLDTARAEIDAFTCDMILAMLQKMSLRRQQRLDMIGMGLVEWLIYHLNAEINKIGTYRLEYTTALLWNLSLHRQAQVRAATMTTILLSTLTELLSSTHLPALPYVNGTLNNFLANRTINEEAKKIGLDAVLEYHRKRNTGEIRRHLEYILKRHRRLSSEAIEENRVMLDDDSEEFDVLENELDESDPVKVDAGELFGELLLATCYAISPNNSNRISAGWNDEEEASLSARSTKFHLAQSTNNNHQTNGISRDAINAPRFTPACCKLTRKNTTALKLIELPENFFIKINKVESQLVTMIDKSVAAALLGKYTSAEDTSAEDTSENTSELENDVTPDDGDTYRSVNATPLYSYSNESCKNSISAAVNSAATTFISPFYETAGKVDDRMTTSSGGSSSSGSGSRSDNGCRGNGSGSIDFHSLPKME